MITAYETIRHQLDKAPRYTHHPAAKKETEKCASDNKFE
ncbi:hypothetical protein V9T40_001766 [Parthenolecanium corni]|uniref:Uncharacterized protein n=1 Tax=Parthenolecanium corni TaxID=536013 RepID=A0AAN9TJL8_9HEMI